MGQADDTSGANGTGNENKDTITVDPAIEALRVSNQTLEKRLAEQSKLALETTKKLADLEKQKLEGTGDFKALWETERKTREELEAKNGRLTTGFMLAQKKVAAETALRSAGMNDEALRLLSPSQFDVLQAEVDDSGMIQVKGTETLVADWKKQFPTLFGKPAPNVNGSTGNGGNLEPKVFTARDLLDIEKKHGVRSKELRDATDAFMEQKRKQNSR